MSSAIPPRLSVPILLDGASSILSLGHRVAEKFASLLGAYVIVFATAYVSNSVTSTTQKSFICTAPRSKKAKRNKTNQIKSKLLLLTSRPSLTGNVWGNLDRPTVLQHVAPLSSLATLVLDYRRAYGDQSEAAGEVFKCQCNILLPEFGVTHLVIVRSMI
jgi:hypothetical protein